MSTKKCDKKDVSLRMLLENPELLEAPSYDERKIIQFIVKWISRYGFNKLYLNVTITRQYFCAANSGLETQ